MTEEEGLIVRTLKNRVLTLRMNNPKRLNGWTEEMMRALKSGLSDAGDDPEVGAVILTGTGHYYCAGVNLGGTLKLGHPRTIHRLIVEHNQDLFDRFIDFPKPILAAINGPAIGAAVTSAALCDGIIAAQSATFSTPFAALGICPEGCSSVHFPRLMSPENAERMLGDEGWQPNAEEALDAGFAQWLASDAELQEKAQSICEEWIETQRQRTYLAGATQEELKQVNAAESRLLADCFLAPPFLKTQFRFLWRKKKRVPSLMFFILWFTAPVWSLLLPKPSARKSIKAENG